MLRIWVLYFCVVAAFCFGDSLPSWNEGDAKQALLQFVKDVTTKGEKDYLPLEDRIATFDQDGTLWVEQPVYTQFTFALDSIRSRVTKHPEWLQEEPFRSIIECHQEDLRSFSAEDIKKIITLTHAGMTMSEFQDLISVWLKTKIHPRFQRPYTQLVYQPMLELIELLKEHGFKVYIVSGGGQEFIRNFSDKVYGIPSEQVIGSAGKIKYEYRNNTPVLVKLPEILFINDKKGKPESINLFIGKRPVAAFGNSNGDREMLEWSQTVPGKSLQLLVHHDDAVREYAYDTESRIGNFSKDLMDEAKNRKWIVVSMKNDWKVIFPWEDVKRDPIRTCEKRPQEQSRT